MNHSMLRLISLFAFAIASLHAQTTDLRSSFINPPPDTRPGCYWYWINDNISKEGLTKDLEAMARVGIGRAYIGQPPFPRPPVRPNGFFRGLPHKANSLQSLTLRE